MDISSFQCLVCKFKDTLKAAPCSLAGLLQRPQSQVLPGELLSSAGASWFLLIENDRYAGMRAGRFPPADI